MPIYTCEKCARQFPQKSGYTAHLNKKKPCTETTAIAPFLAKMEEVEKEIKEIKAAAKGDLVLPADEEGRKKVLMGFFEDLHNMLRNHAGSSPEKAIDNMSIFFAFRMLEIQADILQLPQECRWSYVASIKNADDLFTVFRKGMEGFRKNDMTKRFFQKMHDIQKAEILYDIVREISRIPLSMLQETDALGDLYEYMLGRGMNSMSEEGQYFTNRKICKFAFYLAYRIKQTLRRKDGTLCTFGDWFCGTGGFTTAYVKGAMEMTDVDWKRDAASIYSQDMNLSSVTTTHLNLLIQTGFPFSNTKICNGNSFTDPILRGPTAPFKGLELDYCFMNPPYGGDKKTRYKFAYTKGKGKDKRYLVNEEIQSIGVEDDDKVSAGVQLAMASLSQDGGVCCIVLPQGFFFDVTKKPVELRKKIAEDYKIHYVVDIASGSFINTTTKTSMLVFQRGVGPTETVQFIGLDEKVLVEATLDDLRTRNYSLNYKQYLPQSGLERDGFEMVRLGDVCEIESGSYITKKTAEEGAYPVYGGGDVSAYISEFNRDTKFVIAKDGVSPTCVRYVYGKFFLNHHGWTFKTKENANYHYIGNWLLANQSVLYNLAAGTAQKGINQESFYNIQIPLPSLEKQQEIVEAIDGFTQLAHAEEQSLKLLEKQVMFFVKEMGRGKERVKLGGVCEIHFGKRITKKDALGTVYPVYGGGDDTFRTDQKNREGFTCKVSRFGISEHNCVQTIYGDYWLMDSGFTVNGVPEKCSDVYLYYWLVQNKERVYQCGRATAQMNIDMDTFRSLEIPLPSLAEQQTLQGEFDEIRHKHAKIAEYRAKAQEAIQRLIPSPRSNAESHSSTCEVDAYGNGCTCRDEPLEEEEFEEFDEEEFDEFDEFDEVEPVAAVAAAPAPAPAAPAVPVAPCPPAPKKRRPSQ